MGFQGSGHPDDPDDPDDRHVRESLYLRRHCSPALFASAIGDIRSDGNSRSSANSSRDTVAIFLGHWTGSP